MPRLCSSLLLLLLIASPGSAVTMAWTPIGNPGNACDPQNPGCFGSVGYDYDIGTYEVTNAQYVEFLNAKAASDPLFLYDPNMGDTQNQNGSGITRGGSSGSYTYSAVVGRENLPVNYVSYFDALRFVNWMNNGKGSGDTETGSYTLLGGTFTPSNSATVTRNAGAVIVLPNDDEWYKAAYYNGSTYFDFPTGTDAQITCAAPNGAGNQANCGYAVGDLTAVGSYTGSASPYGTFDQAGNVAEWNDAVLGDGSKVYRGGDFAELGDFARGGARFAGGPYTAADFIGFRIAMVVPEPTTGLLVIAGLLGLGARRRIGA